MAHAREGPTRRRRDAVRARAEGDRDRAASSTSAFANGLPQPAIPPDEFLPDLSCFNHATTRNRVLAVGKAIEAETRAEIAEKPKIEKPVDHVTVGIDGAFVKATRSKNQRKNFKIVLARIEVNGRQEKTFAAVRDLDDLARERVRSALRSAGRGSATNVTVFSDGEDALRLMAGQWLNGRVRCRAWARSFFLIAMKLPRLAATFRKLKPRAGASTNSKVISIRTSFR